MLPTSVPDCHLVRTAIPFLHNSLDDFHYRQADSWSLLQPGFQKATNTALGHDSTVVFSHSPQSTQDRLLCTQLSHRIAGSIPVRRSPIIRMNGKENPRVRVSTAIGLELHAIVIRPKALTPSTHPNLGERSKHKGLHRYAL